jgi:hypothetical protein
MIRTLILSLLLSACSVDPDAFSVDYDMRSAFEQASARWCEATNGARCPTIDPGGASSAMVVSREYLARFAAPGETWYGACTTWPSGESLIGISEDLGESKLVSAITHELGHHCGCGHSADPGSAMAIPTLLDSEITAEDAACAR